MSKIKRTYSLKNETVQKIERLAVEKNLNRTEVIEYAIDYIFGNRSEEHHVLMAAIKEIKEDLKRIRVTGNVIDRNVQMELEFWNHYFIVNKFSGLASTEKYKTEELKEAEVVVKNRIAHNRQRKVDWESKRKKEKT